MICCPNCSTPIDASPNPHLPLEDRLWMRIQKQPPPEGIEGECWVWMGSAAGGYGQIMIGNVAVKVHRVMYEMLVGTIGDGLQLDHLCRVTRCCNPGHLEPVSARVNILRSTGPAAINGAKTHCKNGHEFTSDNTIWRKEGGRKCRTCHYGAIIRRRREAGVRPWEQGKAGCPPSWVPTPKS